MMTRKDLGQYRTIPPPVALAAQPCAMRPGAISSSACHTHQRPVWECIHMLLAAVETLPALRLELADATDAMEWAFSHLDRGDGVLEVTDTLDNIERAMAKRRLVHQFLAQRAQA